MAAHTLPGVEVRVSSECFPEEGPSVIPASMMQDRSIEVIFSM